MSSSRFDAVDFFRSSSVYHQDRYPYYEYLREHGPVWREPHHGVFMITGYEEALEVYHDSDTFSNCNVVAGPFAEWPVPLEGDDISEIIEKYRDQLSFSDQLPAFDPPKHTAHRALLGRLLTPKRLKENEEFMWELAGRQLDEFVGRGSCEFVRDYAQPFTLLVVADLLGVPESEHATFREELQGDNRKIQAGGAGTGGMMSHKPLEFLYDRFTRYIEERRREPRDDVMTGMANARFPDGSLPEVRDVMLITCNLFAAGGETTARLLGAMLRKLAESPDLQQQIRKNRELIPNFAEETLRLEAPLQAMSRLARVRTRIGGVDIPAGSTLMLIPAAANRDPRQFQDPAEFRLGRPNWRQHLSFGFGIHSCAGAPLARAEVRISTERILDRMADIRISEKEHGPPGARRYEHPDTYMIRGVERLHLEFTPVG
jgi:cytochrome P450